MEKYTRDQTWFQELPQSYNNQDRMVLAKNNGIQKQPMEDKTLSSETALHICGQ